MPFAFGFCVQKVEAFLLEGVLDFLELGGKDAGYDEAAVGGQAVDDAVGFADEEVGDEVGADDVELFAGGDWKFREIVAAAEDFVIDAVAAEVGLGDADGDGVEVEGFNWGVAEFGGGDGEDSRATTDIEERGGD